MILAILLQTTPGDVKGLVDLAGAITAPACLLIGIVAFARGWVVTPTRLKDWQERTKYEQDRADRLEKALTEFTNKIDSNTQALSALKEVFNRIIDK